MYTKNLLIYPTTHVEFYSASSSTFQVVKKLSSISNGYICLKTVRTQINNWFYAFSYQSMCRLNSMGLRGTGGGGESCHGGFIRHPWEKQFEIHVEAEQFYSPLRTKIQIIRHSWEIILCLRNNHYRTAVDHRETVGVLNVLHRFDFFHPIFLTRWIPDEVTIHIHTHTVGKITDRKNSSCSRLVKHNLRTRRMRWRPVLDPR